jgi:hypothetical protein
MIIKVVKRSRAVGGRSADVVALKRLSTYLHNEKKTPLRDKDRVLDSWFTNTDMQSREAGLREMTAVMSLNTTAKGDKWFHLIISFPEGEVPTKEQLLDIETAISGTLNLSTHQRFSVLHGDTDNRHLHLVISKIDPERYRMIEPYRAYPKLQEVARALEKKHGLTLGYDGVSKAPQNRKGAQSREDMEAHRAAESYLDWLVRNGGDELKSALKSGSWKELQRAVKGLGSAVVERGRGFVVTSETGKGQVKLSEVLQVLGLRGVMKSFPAFSEAGKFPGIEPSVLVKHYVDREHKSSYERTLYDLYQKERAKKGGDSGPITWREYLQREAENDDRALLLLRRQRGIRPKGRQAAERFEAMRLEMAISVTIERSLRYRVHRNGDVSYFVGTQGRFCDHGETVSVLGVNEESVRAAMKFAVERFGEALTVKGSREFVELSKRIGREEKVGLRQGRDLSI